MSKRGRRDRGQRDRGQQTEPQKTEQQKTVFVLSVLSVVEFFSSFFNHGFHRCHRQGPKIRSAKTGTPKPNESEGIKRIFELPQIQSFFGFNSFSRKTWGQPNESERIHQSHF